MNIIIIDHNKENQGSLSKLLRLFCTNISIIGCADCPKKGLNIINSSDPDLVFLDINSKNYSEPILDIKSSWKKFHTVLLSHEEATSNKIKLLKTNTLSCLQKPIDPIALIECVKEVRIKLKQQLYPDFNSFNNSPKKTLDRIGIPTSKGTQYIALDKVIYLRARNNYTEIIREEGKPILISKSLKSFERILEGTFFTRVHQSYLVNLEKVIELQRIDGGLLILNNNSKIPISRANKQQIKRRLEETWKII